MHLVPFMIQMCDALLRQNASYRLGKNENEGGRFIYFNEKKLDQFLEQGIQMKKDFLSKIEEVKRADEIEEEVKDSQSELDSADQIMREAAAGGNDDDNNMSDLSLDQIAFMLT